MLHYRSDLTKLMKHEKSTDSTNEKWNCLSCSKVFSTEKSLIYHLISTHKAIAEHIPAKDSKEIQRSAKHQKVQIVFKRKKKLALKKNIQSEQSKINVSNESSSNEEDFNPEEAGGTITSMSSKPKMKVSDETSSDETSSDEDDFNQEKATTSQKISSKQKVEEKDEFRCNVCNGKNSNKRNLLRHMALIHFRQELLKRFKKTQNNKNQNDLSQNDLVQINKSQNDISQINKNQNDLSQDDISQNDLSQDDLNQDDLSQNDLSINSESQNIKSQNDKTQNECGLCGKNFGDENYLLCHIANVHKGLEKLISAQTSQN